LFGAPPRAGLAGGGAQKQKRYPDSEGDRVYQYAQPGDNTGQPFLPWPPGAEEIKL
jgi:hypothetical protein